MMLTRIFNKIKSKRLDISVKVVSWYTRIYARTYGIKIGKNCLFFKSPSFQLFNDSTITIGENCQFRSGALTNLFGINHPCIISTLSSGAIIKIGSGSGFSGTTIGAAEHIEIGMNVMVGANSVITDFDWHSMDPWNRNDGPKISRKVIIGDRVWIGANCLVLKGVTIGENTVVGAGSIVTTSLPANMICAGNPCKPIKALNAGH